MTRMGLLAGAALLALTGAGAASAAPALFVTNFGIGMIGEYTTAGTPVNPALISGLSDPFGIAIANTSSPVPEPASLSLLAVGLLGLAGVRRVSRCRT